MPITSTLSNPKDVVIIQRDDTNTFYQEVHTSGSLVIPYLNASGYVDFDTSQSFYSIFPPPVGGLIPGNTYPITASWAQTSSYVSSPIKTYRALLTQIGTSAPTTIILENTLGGVPVWSYQGVGNYYLALSGAFPVNKTFWHCGAPSTSNILTIDNIFNNSTCSYKVSTFMFKWANLLNLQNNTLLNTPIEIIVYP